MELNRTCAHVMTDGDTCGAYSLRDSDLCYWHHKAREARGQRSRLNRKQKAKPSGLVLPLLEDANSIQLALQMIAQAIADRRIARAEAGILLYSIQLAITNLKNVKRPESIYSLRMLVVPSRGDENEDITTCDEIPIERDPDFKYGMPERTPEVDDEEEDDDEELEVNEEEIKSVEEYFRKNHRKLKRLGVIPKDLDRLLSESAETA